MSNKRPSLQNEFDETHLNWLKDTIFELERLK